MTTLPMTILLKDDEEDFVQLLSLRLEDKGHQVRKAYSGEEALAGMAELEPDVVLLDLKMPGMDGMTALKAMKTAHPEVEVLLLTGHGTIDAVDKGLKAGACDCLIKPADFHELLRKLEVIRSRKSGRKERACLKGTHFLPGKTEDMRCPGKI